MRKKVFLAMLLLIALVLSACAQATPIQAPPQVRRPSPPQVRRPNPPQPAKPLSHLPRVKRSL